MRQQPVCSCCRTTRAQRRDGWKQGWESPRFRAPEAAGRRRRLQVLGASARLHAVLLTPPPPPPSINYTELVPGGARRPAWPNPRLHRRRTPWIYLRAAAGGSEGGRASSRAGRMHTWLSGSLPCQRCTCFSFSRARGLLPHHLISSPPCPSPPGQRAVRPALAAVRQLLPRHLRPVHARGRTRGNSPRSGARSVPPKCCSLLRHAPACQPGELRSAQSAGVLQQAGGRRYCASSCERCRLALPHHASIHGGCTDDPPPGEAPCAEQKAWGKCHKRLVAGKPLLRRHLRPLRARVGSLLSRASCAPRGERRTRCTSPCS